MLLSFRGFVVCEVTVFLGRDRECEFSNLYRIGLIWEALIFNDQGARVAEIYARAG